MKIIYVRLQNSQVTSETVRTWLRQEKKPIKRRKNERSEVAFIEQKRTIKQLSGILDKKLAKSQDVDRIISPFNVDTIKQVLMNKDFLKSHFHGKFFFISFHFLFIYFPSESLRLFFSFSLFNSFSWRWKAESKMMASCFIHSITSMLYSFMQFAEKIFCSCCSHGFLLSSITFSAVLLFHFHRFWLAQFFYLGEFFFSFFRNKIDSEVISFPFLLFPTVFHNFSIQFPLQCMGCAFFYHSALLHSLCPS